MGVAERRGCSPGVGRGRALGRPLPVVELRLRVCRESASGSSRRGEALACDRPHRVGRSAPRRRRTACDERRPGRALSGRSRFHRRLDPVAGVGRPAARRRGGVEEGDGAARGATRRPRLGAEREPRRSRRRVRGTGELRVRRLEASRSSDAAGLRAPGGRGGAGEAGRLAVRAGPLVRPESVPPPLPLFRGKEPRRPRVRVPRARSSGATRPPSTAARGSSLRASGSRSTESRRRSVRASRPLPREAPKRSSTISRHWRSSPSGRGDGRSRGALTTTSPIAGPRVSM